MQLLVNWAKEYKFFKKTTSVFLKALQKAELSASIHYLFSCFKSLSLLFWV